MMTSTCPNSSVTDRRSWGAQVLGTKPSDGKIPSSLRYNAGCCRWLALGTSSGIPQGKVVLTRLTALSHCSNADSRGLRAGRPLPGRLSNNSCSEVHKDLHEITTAMADIYKYAFPGEMVSFEWLPHTLGTSLPMTSGRQGLVVCMGSRAEGLLVPIHYHLSAGTLAAADTDYMVQVLSNQNHTYCCGGQPFGVQLEADDQRYATLLVSCNYLRRSIVENCPEHDGEYVPKMYVRVTEPVPDVSGMNSGANGPAVWSTFLPKMAEHIFKSFSLGLPPGLLQMSGGLSSTTGDVDFVQAVVFENWPDTIRLQWLHRRRPHGWPTKDVVERVTEEKCMATPTGRRGETVDRTWRLSFSAPERFVALSLTAIQRTAFVLWKFLMKDLPATRALRTFYLKNLLFWVCEKYPAQIWRANNLERCFSILLEELCERLRSRFLGSFFVPSSNLFDGEDFDFAAARQQLVEAKSRLSDHFKRALSQVANLSSMTVNPHPLMLAAQHFLFPSAVDGVGMAEKMLLFVLKSLAGVLGFNTPKNDPVVFKTIIISLHSLLGRMIVDAWSSRRTLVRGSYRFTTEMAAFQDHCRRVYVSANYKPDQKMQLLLDAFYKMKLRGQDPLETGSFVPMAERYCKLLRTFFVGLTKGAISSASRMWESAPSSNSGFMLGGDPAASSVVRSHHATRFSYDEVD